MFPTVVNDDIEIHNQRSRNESSGKFRSWSISWIRITNLIYVSKRKIVLVTEKFEKLLWTDSLYKIL